jgi:hypothetical protein
MPAFWKPERPKLELLLKRELLLENERPEKELLRPNPVEPVLPKPLAPLRDVSPAFPKWEAPEFAIDRFPPANAVFVAPRLPIPGPPVTPERSGIVRALGGRSDWKRSDPPR